MKHIFMLSSQLLFSRGVEDLLRQQAGLEIVGHETDAARALARIRDLKPDAVILDSKDLASSPSTIVALILREAPAAKVIALNLENDRISVYRGEQRTAQSVDDLRQVIDEDRLAPMEITSEDWMSLAAGRAQVYGFLAALFSRTIDERLLDNLGASFVKFIDSLERDNDLTGDLSEGLRAFERFRREAARPREVIKAELMTEYARLVEEGGSEDEFGYASEAMYVSLETRSTDSIRAALNAAYAEGGMRLAASSLTHPDFIGCELEFMQQLCLKECAAWTKNDPHEALKCQGLERTFLRDHLVRWAPRLCDAWLMQTNHDFYRGAAHLTKGFILNEAYRVMELMEWTCVAEESIVGELS